jgi:hypothetical protein
MKSKTVATVHGKHESIRVNQHTHIFGEPTYTLYNVREERTITGPYHSQPEAIEAAEEKVGNQ